ncbi:MAG: sulfatase-like hydrolase/transferase [Planctomycetaceae bacterium]|nr:sulfatase-like hydrolase/transferase [Planctomycetaceae bacterium]
MPQLSRRVVPILTLFVSLAQVVNTGFAGTRPNILLIVSDDQRPDTIQSLGNPLIQTPHLDRLVMSGVAFTRATCGNPICTPSRAEILTGCCSFRNGVLDFGKPISPRVPRLAHWFTRAGYQTHYVGKWHNDGGPAQHGYQTSRGLYRGGGGKFSRPQVDWADRPVTGYRGWVFQDESGQLFPDLGVGLTPDISSKIADAAIACVEHSAQSNQPFLLHVNFTAPHDPLLLPPGWEQAYDPQRLPLPANFLPRHPFDHGNIEGRDELLFAWPRTPRETLGELAAYYAVISHMDAQIGRILAALHATGLAQNTLIVFTSDHGLAIGSHGLRGKQNMYEHTIGVPLVISGPGIPAGERRNAQCYLRDLFPTLTDLAEIDSPGEQIDGRSLVPVLRGEREEIHPFIVGYFRHAQRMIRAEGWKYIEYPEAGIEQLFDLTNDPHELTNLANEPRHDARRKLLNGLLHEWLQAHGDPSRKQE